MRPNTNTITTKTRPGTFLVFAIVFAAFIAFAHEGFEHVMGTVTKLNPRSVTVQTTASKTVEVRLDAKTAYARGTDNVSPTDLKVGDRVVIDAAGEAPKLVAVTIKIGAAAASPASHDDHAHK